MRYIAVWYLRANTSVRRANGHMVDAFQAVRMNLHCVSTIRRLHQYNGVPNNPERLILRRDKHNQSDIHNGGNGSSSVLVPMFPGAGNFCWLWNGGDDTSFELDA
jgi:hypothetical protein